jgi:hypothetical protein
LAQPVNASMVGDLVKRSANVGGLQEKKKFLGEVGGDKNIRLYLALISACLLVLFLKFGILN